jgi:maltose alpha-D-glucosyltransferase/alpha-amylase
MNGLLFSLPGTPIIYYGDEIGMGDNIYLGDRNGVRTPMQWSADRNAGFSRANPQRLYMPVIIDPQYHYEQVNVESQNASQNSLLWWMKRLISLRKRYHAFGRGSLEFLHPENRKILAFIRQYENETILVVANLSRLVQCFDLDLHRFRGMVPTELSGGTQFPEIGERPYFLNLGPFSFYWFALEKRHVEEITIADDLPLIGAKTWEEVFANRSRDALATALLRYIRSRRWFGGKARTVTGLVIRDVGPLPRQSAQLALVEIEYTEGEPQVYVLPLAMMHPRKADEPESAKPTTIIARLRDGGILYEPVSEDFFSSALLELIARRRQVRGSRGVFSGTPARGFRELRGEGPLEAQAIKAEQSNTAIVYGHRLFLKLFRRLEPGESPDLEILRFLNEETSFDAVPRLAGALEYRLGREPEEATVGVLQDYTKNSGDAWSYSLDAISRFFERILSDRDAADRVARGVPSEAVFDLAMKPSPPLAEEMIGAYLPDADLLGRRTAQLHVALASRDDIPAFAPEPFTLHYQRSIYQLFRTQLSQTIHILKKRERGLPDLVREEIAHLLSREPEIQQRIREILEGRIGGNRIRIHGDYHLGQVLHTGADFVIIDFEGEPTRPLTERRIKRSALRDVAGMLRSFHYAPHAVVFGQAPGFVIRSEDVAALESGARFWHRWVSGRFLRAYLDEAAKGRVLPENITQARSMLRCYLIEKALYEIVYELNNRPDWVRIPIRGVLDLLG